jgi:hypothetical protein
MKTPANKPGTVLQMPIVAMPTAAHARAMRAERAGPTMSGMRAPKLRISSSRTEWKAKT